jgi:hypothetical protein
MKRLRNTAKSAAAGERSILPSNLPREWLDRLRTERLRREISEGCLAMTDVYREVEQAYHPLEEEVAHALDVSSCGGLNSDREDDILRSERRLLFPES